MDIRVFKTGSSGEGQLGKKTEIGHHIGGKNLLVGVVVSPQSGRVVGGGPRHEISVALPGRIDEAGTVLAQKDIIPVLPICLRLVVGRIVLRIIGSSILINKTGLIVVPLRCVDIKPRFEFAGIILLLEIGHGNIGNRVVLPLRKLPLIPLERPFRLRKRRIPRLEFRVIPRRRIIGILEKPLVRLNQLGLTKPPNPIDFNFPERVNLVVPVQLHIAQLSFAVLDRGVLELRVGRQRGVQSFVGNLEVRCIRGLLVENHVDRHPVVLIRLDGKIRQPAPKNILRSLVIA